MWMCWYLWTRTRCACVLARVAAGTAATCVLRALQNDFRRAAREAVAGMRMGGLTLEPQDVEVLTKVLLVWHGQAGVISSICGWGW
jgi:hypothetical protein